MQYSRSGGYLSKTNAGNLLYHRDSKAALLSQNTSQHSQLAPLKSQNLTKSASVQNYYDCTQRCMTETTLSNNLSLDSSQNSVGATSHGHVSNHANNHVTISQVGNRTQVMNAACDGGGEKLGDCEQTNHQGESLSEVATPLPLVPPKLRKRTGFGGGWSAVRHSLQNHRLSSASSTGTGVFPSANSNNSVSSYNPVSTNINYPNSTPPAQFTNSNGFNMKNFIKSRTSSIGNSSSQKSKQNNSQLADPKNPVIVHLSMQQNSSSSSSGNGGISSNNDQQIYLNPSDVFTPGDLPDPSRHQFEPPNISLASGVHPVTSRPPATVPPQPASFLPAQNYPVMSAEVTPQATPIASKKLQNHNYSSINNNNRDENSNSAGSSAGFSNYMPMSECGSQNSSKNSKDSGRGTHEQHRDSLSSQFMTSSHNQGQYGHPQHGIYPLENLYYDESQNERRMRHHHRQQDPANIQMQQQSKMSSYSKHAQHKSMKKYLKDRSSHAHQRRSKRMGRSLSASSLSTVDKNGVRRSRERGGGVNSGAPPTGGGHTYKVYDGDFLTKPGNIPRGVNDDNTTNSVVSQQVKHSSRGRQSAGVSGGSALPRGSKHDSEHFESVADSTHERDRSYSNACHCQCEQTLDLVARKVEHLKLAILEKMEYSMGSTDRKMDELDKKVRHQLNSLDKIFKDRVGGEKTEAIQRMDKKIIQERMAIAEEIRKTEMRVDRSLKDWCESRYQRVDSRLQGSSDRAHSDSGLSRRHSIGDGSSSVGTGEGNKCYRDSGAFECSSTASNSDVGVKTPSDSFPVKTPWTTSSPLGQPNPASRHHSATKRESPLVSEKSTTSSARCSIQSSSSSATNNSLAQRSRGASPVNSSANLSIHSHSSGGGQGKADSISDILDYQMDIYATNVQQYGTVRRKSRPRLETSSTAFDDNESCFGDNESVSKIPILTLPSENFGKLGGSGGSQQSQPHLKSTTTSAHQRSSSTSGSHGHFMIQNQNNPKNPTGCNQLPDMSEDLRQFNSQYLNRQGNAGKIPTNPHANGNPKQGAVSNLYDEKQYPPCDFEKMKRLDSANESPVPPHKTTGGQNPAQNIPPVLPPRGLEMSRSNGAQSQPSCQAAPDEREALQRRIKELEETLNHITLNSSQSTTTSSGTKAI